VRKQRQALGLQGIATLSGATRRVSGTIALDKLEALARLQVVLSIAPAPGK
jgi:hypothetical protein